MVFRNIWAGLAATTIHKGLERQARGQLTAHDAADLQGWLHSLRTHARPLAADLVARARGDAALPPQLDPEPAIPKLLAVCLRDQGDLPACIRGPYLLEEAMGFAV